MVRTQISLGEDAYERAKEAARRQHISLAEFLRRAVAVALGPQAGTGRPWMRHAGTLASGDPDASRSVDRIVYGRPRP
jgi:Ribbon-helix-helix protein, copG family